MNSFYKKNTTRRSFIKTKLLGGLAITAGIPFIGWANKQNAFEPSKSTKFTVLNKPDWESVRAQFLFVERKYYFNSATLGSSPEVVINAICDTLKDLGRRARDGRWLIQPVREKLATFLNTDSSRIAFTRNTTEGMNIVAHSLSLNAGDEIIITDQEHIGGSAPWIALQKEFGVKVKVVQLNLSGEGNIEKIKHEITEKTKVISVSHITCTTGLILPVKEIVELCRERNIYSCIDGAQAVGMTKVDLDDLKPDFYVGNGHKWLYGPLGTGFLFISDRVIEQCKPVFHGAHSVESFDLMEKRLVHGQAASREEYGTRNVPNIVGFGAAIDFVNELGMNAIEEHSRVLVQRLVDGVEDLPGVELLTPTDPNLSSSIITIRIPEKDGAAIKEKLRIGKGLVVRHIYEGNLDAIRISLSVYNNESDVDYLLNALLEIVKETNNDE